MRKTNQQKYNEIQVCLVEKKQAFLAEYFSDKAMPNMIYKAEVNGIKEIPTTKITVYSKDEPHNTHRVITNQYLQKVSDFVTNFEYHEKYVLFHYTEQFQTHSSSGAFKMDDFGEGKRLSFKKDDLIQIQRELNEKYAERDGYKPCSYCATQVPENTLVPYTIIFQNSKSDPFSRNGYKRFVDKKTNRYCSQACGVYDQMAHEG